MRFSVVWRIFTAAITALQSKTAGRVRRRWIYSNRPADVSEDTTFMALATAQQKPNVTLKAPIVWLAVSSFRNDHEIALKLEDVQRLPRHPFYHILVVDSIGTGAIPELIEKRGWSNVTYRSYDHNLGAAGNLRERLRIATAAGADFVYALNHDGALDLDVIHCLLDQALRLKRVGAVYPLSYLAAAGAYNVTGSRKLPLPAKLVREKPSGDFINAYWSSCNGALYSTEPVTRGVLPDTGLWHGWEDLDYGLRLNNEGYSQVIACGATFKDNYEYVRVDTPTGHYRVVDKPAWMTYYMIRNLILIARWARPSLVFPGVVALRVALECLVILFFRPDKGRRFRYLMTGVIDGLQNRTGKWILPVDPVTTS
jgi:GT2 family glycosyltransferase